MRSLLDVNVLLALLDRDHVDHRRARGWVIEEIGHGCAPCAITQNGFVRIIGQVRYPSPVSPSHAISLPAKAVRTQHHEFWPCTVSVLDEGVVAPTRVHSSKQVTGGYLLALAVANQGRFVTFDQDIAVATVPGAGDQHLVVL